MLAVDVRPVRTHAMSNATVAPRLWYPYEEFADHMRAMKTVRTWEYTSRFGHVGHGQHSRANVARVVEYFSDTYPEPNEAVHKAQVFLSIHDYVGRHAALFTRKRLLEELGGGLLSVDPALLRAVHYVFTAVAEPAGVDPKKVLGLAAALKEIGTA
jgi:hypothetical protein